MLRFIAYLFSSSLSPTDLDQPCNADCGCSLQSYEPVCGLDGVQYFSSCHAGCRSVYEVEGQDTVSGMTKIT